MKARKVKKYKHVTREDWRMAAANLLEDRFNDAGARYPERYRVTVSLPSGGVRSTKTIGQCWYAGSSTDKTREIFISPVLDDALEVLGTLAHELCHACLPEGTGHRKPFSDLGKKLFLDGKPKQMGNGPEFDKKIGAPLLEALGPYPHAAMKFVSKTKQSTRLIKCMCDCGYTARVTRKWIDEAGPPICPACEEPMSVGFRPRDRATLERAQVELIPLRTTIDSLEQVISS